MARRVHCWPSSGTCLGWGRLCTELEFSNLCWKKTKQNCMSFLLPWRISLVAERACLQIESLESGWNLWAPWRISLYLAPLFSAMLAPPSPSLLSRDWLLITALLRVSSAPFTLYTLLFQFLSFFSVPVVPADDPWTYFIFPARSCCA